MTAHETKTFRSGNSVAVRLPKELGYTAGMAVRLERDGDGLRIRPIRDANATRRLMQQLIDGLDAIGRPGAVEKRIPFEFPERPGLL